MKKPKWARCRYRSAISDEKLVDFNGPVAVGMKVTAEYKNIIVLLTVTKALSENEFEASVQGFEPVNMKPPYDLKEGDIVLIDRQHICGI